MIKDVILKMYLVKNIVVEANESAKKISKQEEKQDDSQEKPENIIK